MPVIRLNIRKTFVLMAALSILIALLIIAVTIYVFFFHMEQTPEAELYALPVIALLSLIGVVITVLLLQPISVHIMKLEQMEDSLDNLSKLNNIMRAQRHDFMNHLQVVHSLIELDEHTEANAYIEKVYSSVEKISSILKTGVPAVNAILEAKRRACESKGIEVTVVVNTSLSEIPVPDWELCRVLGNIIDNSVSALSGAHGERWINIEMFEDIHSYRFRISNNGPAIPKELWGRIFEAGYTTKARDGEGMGLTICSKILSRYGGNIWVLSDEYDTVFEGFVPRLTGEAGRKK